MSPAFQTAFTVALLVSFVLLIGYQIGMLIWTKKMAGEVPKTIKVLRSLNMAVLLAAVIMIVLQLTRGS